jgi:hypothetical protein
MMISAEEEVPTLEAVTGNRQSKQIIIVPQLSPERAYPSSYFSGSPYELPLMMPKQTPFIRRNPVLKQQQLAASNWPYTYPLLSSPGNQSIFQYQLNIKKKQYRNKSKYITRLNLKNLKTIAKKKKRKPLPLGGFMTELTISAI